MAKTQQRLARVLRELAVELGSQAEVAKQSGVSRASVCRISRGAMPTAKNLAKFRSAFGGRIPEMDTESDRRREQAKTLLAEHGSKAHTTVARANQAKAQRGRPRPAQSTAMRSYHASSRQRPATDQLTKIAQSAEGRARISLGKFLYSTPRPSGDDLAAWAKLTAARLALSPADVELIWRPVLQDRGLKTRRGRQPFDDRRELVESLMREWPRTPSGRLAAGFWAHAARRVRENEGCDISAEDVRTWYRDHMQAVARPSPSLQRRRARAQARAEAHAAELARRYAAESETAIALLTIGEVAVILGVNRSTVQELERGHRLPKSGTGRRRFMRTEILANKDSLRPTQCRATRVDGRPCTAWALREDIEGRCRAHARHAECGTLSGYAAHRRRGETPCQACREANAVYYRDRRAA